MEIEIIEKEKVITKIDSLKINKNDKNGLYNVVLDFDNKKNFLTVKKEIGIIISYTTVNNKKWIYAELNLNLKTLRQKSTNLYEGIGAIIFLNQEDYSVYNQYVVDIFLDWKTEKEFEWRKASIEKKKAYIDACSLWQGRSIGLFEYKKEYLLDCSIVKDKYDLYILFAETLLGKRAYLGSNLDAFYDSLIDFKDLVGRRDVNIKFLSHKNMLKVIDDQCFIKHIFDILSEHHLSFNLS